MLMKRKALALILAMLFSVAVGTQLVDLGSANPYLRDFVEEREMPAPEGTEPLIISIFSPENYTTFASNNISLIFNVTMPESIRSYRFSEIYYKASWQPNKTYVDYGNTINLTDIPEGSHYLEVVAVAKYMGHTTYQEIKQGFHLITYYVSYRLNGSSTVNFTIDLPPKISIPSLKNKTYSTSNVKLDFTVNETISEVAYSLDGKDNVTITGNTTLTGLSNGVHNVTVYAWDEAGKVGASETIYFSVEVPFPTTLVIAPVTSVAIVSAGLLVYFKKRKKEPGDKS